MSHSYPLAAAILLSIAAIARADAAQGLDSLSDDPVRVELATDGMQSVLERAFVVDRVPPDRQRPERAIIALKELSTSQLTPQQRSERVRAVIEGINAVLPEMTDPDVLMTDAAMLVEAGVNADINTLEFFGETDSDLIKARVRPAVETAVAMYERAMTITNARQETLQNQINGPKSPAIGPWKEAWQQYQNAAYTRWMLSYDNALVLDKADLQRKKIAQQGIDQLKQWDDPETNVQTNVRMQIAKLYMVKGSREDLKTARELFRTIYDPSTPADQPMPVPDQYSQFLARYFSVCCTILAGDGPGAAQAEHELDDWRKKNVPDAREDEYAMALLDYRIALLQQDTKKADAVLQALSNRLEQVTGSPDDVQTARSLRRLILAKLVDQLPQQPDMARLDPLFLSVMIERGWAEAAQPQPDTRVIELALKATDELRKRSTSRPNAQALQNAALGRGVFLKALGKPYESATAFLDYVESYKNDPGAQADRALKEALDEIQTLRQSAGPGHQGPDPEVLWRRLLPLAVDDFNWTDLAFFYARQLQDAHEAAKAVLIFDLVPRDDPNIFFARYFEMFALSQELDDDAVLLAERPGVVSRIEDMAADFTLAAADKAKNAATDKERIEDRTLLLKIKLLTADVARIDGNNPARSLEILADFEQSLDGLPEARSLLSDALNERVQAYMALDQNDKAADALVTYLNTATGIEGSQTVYNLLTKLNQELIAAQSTGDLAKVKAIAQRRALLTPYLVQWARNAKGDIHNYVYRYEVFDAATNKLAAELETDPTLRIQRLRHALAVYQELQSADNFKLYQASLPPGVSPEMRNYPDPVVTLGIGQISFELGDWKTAHDTIGQLLADARLGDGTKLIKRPDGQTELVDNEQFWEAEYDFIKATFEWSKDPASGVDRETPRTMLRQLQAGWGQRVGGQKWHDKFAELAGELNLAVPSAAKTKP